MVGRQGRISVLGAVFCFLNVLKKKGTCYTHHLPADLAETCVSASESAVGCWLVEADSTSSSGLCWVSFWFCSLCVDVAVLILRQDGDWIRLHFAKTTFPYA